MFTCRINNTCGIIRHEDISIGVLSLVTRDSEVLIINKVCRAGVAVDERYHAVGGIVDAIDGTVVQRDGATVGTDQTRRFDRLVRAVGVLDLGRGPPVHTPVVPPIVGCKSMTYRGMVLDPRAFEDGNRNKLEVRKHSED